MESNGVDVAKDYPWKKEVPNYSRMSVSEEEYQDAARSDPLWKNVESLKAKVPMIWEIYNSEVTEVKWGKPSDDVKRYYCRFFNDRAYVVMCWNKTTISSNYDIHIWVSKHCSSEDYKLAAIKAEQLHLRISQQFKGEQVYLHREIQLFESDTFHSHFKVEVRRKKDDDKKPNNFTLLQFRVEGKKQWMIERKFLRGNLCSDDVFVIMNKEVLYQWNGTQCNAGERKAAEEYFKQQKEAISNLTRQVIDETTNDKHHKVYALFPTTGKRVKVKRLPSNPLHTEKFKMLYKLNSDGIKPVAEELSGTININKWTSDSIYFLDTETMLFVWIGDDVSFQERCRAVFAGEDFLSSKSIKFKFNQPNKSITLVNQGNTSCLLFNQALTR